MTASETLSRTLSAPDPLGYGRLHQPDAKLATGQRKLNTAGYVVVKTEGGWIHEHRLVLERKLGRPLKRGESVHHRNGARHDNRPENLELWVGAVPGRHPKTPRRATRDGAGAKVYLQPDELRALADGRVRASLKSKAAAALRRLERKEQR